MGLVSPPSYESNFKTLQLIYVRVKRRVNYSIFIGFQSVWESVFVCSILQFVVFKVLNGRRAILLYIADVLLFKLHLDFLTSNTQLLLSVPESRVEIPVSSFSIKTRKYIPSFHFNHTFLEWISGMIICV